MEIGKKFLRRRIASTKNQDLADKDLSNFRTLINFLYPLYLWSKIGKSQEIKDKRLWMLLVKKEKERRKFLS